MGLIKKISDFAATVRAHARDPLRLEFVLTDACNLNCRGCTHYAPVAPREFVPLPVLRASMEHLGRVCGSDIRRLFLIGGEPLLYPELPEAMRLLRKNFPAGELSIFTNGLLLPRMSEEFWQEARSCRFAIAITRYPIEFDYVAAESLCRRHGVRPEVFADRGDDGSFFRFPLDPQKRNNPRISHFKCFNRGCVSVIGRRVFPCSISGCAEHLNRRFGTDFRHERGDWLDVTEVRSARDIRRLRDRPVPFCGYCVAPAQPAAYGPSLRQPGEWID